MSEPSTAPIRIGTRGSLLARTQSQTIADALTAAGHPAELVIIKTAGDASAAPVAEIGVGVFTTAIRVALRNHEVDVAVHSYKDLPTAPDPRLSLEAAPQTRVIEGVAAVWRLSNAVQIIAGNVATGDAAALDQLLVAVRPLLQQLP